MTVSQTFFVFDDLNNFEEYSLSIFRMWNVPALGFVCYFSLVMLVLGQETVEFKVTWHDKGCLLLEFELEFQCSGLCPF